MVLTTKQSWWWGNTNDKWYFLNSITLTTAYPVGQAWWFATVGNDSSKATLWIRDAETTERVDTKETALWDMLASVYDPAWGNKQVAFKADVLALDQSTPQTIINGMPLFNGLGTSKIKPLGADSTTAIQIMKADGATAIGTWDTINSRLGIGTTSPGSKLEVAGVDVVVRINNTSSNSGNLRFANNGTDKIFTGIVTTDNWGGLLTGTSINDGFTRFDGSKYLFSASTTSHVMTLLSTGNVGIGTTSPGTKLDIATANSNNNLALSLYRGDVTGRLISFMPAGFGDVGLGSNEVYQKIIFGSSGASLGSAVLFSAENSQRFLFNTGGSTRLTILNTGNVGIGTTTPYSLLDVGGSSQVNASIIPVISMTANNDSIRALQLQNKSSGVSAEMRFLAVADDGTYLAFTQPSSGNTGTLFGSTKSTGSFIFNTANNGTKRDLYLGTFDNKNFYIGTNNTVRVTVLDTGNVGIGITNPVYPLQVYNATKSNFAIYTAASKNTAFSFQQGSGNGTTGNNSFFMGIDGNASDINFGYGGGTNDVLMSTYYGGAFRNLLRFPIGTQNAIFYGNVGIGTTSPTAKLSVAEKGAMNEIGGYMIKLTNKTGNNSVKGTVVYASTWTDNAFNINPIDGDMPIGVVYTDGIADGAECRVVVSGIAEVLLVDSVATTRSYVAYSSGTTAWRIDTASTIPAATTHFREIWHTLESKTGWTNVLVKCVLHFN